MNIGASSFFCPCFFQIFQSVNKKEYFWINTSAYFWKIKAYFQKSKVYFLKSKLYFFENVLYFQYKKIGIYVGQIKVEGGGEGVVKDSYHATARISKGKWIGEGLWSGKDF